MAEINLEILAYESTPLGTLCLRRRELLSQPGTIVTEVTLNHEFLMSSLYTDSEEALSRIAIEMHGSAASGESEGVESKAGKSKHDDELQVMIGGLGLGYTARQALLSDRVGRVEVFELLPQVIEWLEQGLVPLSSTLLPELHNDQQTGTRLKITPGDVYQRLASAPQKLFDLILIDVDHSPDDRLDRESVVFYSRAGLQAAKKHLAPGGVLGVWSYAKSSPFADALRTVFDEVRVVPVTHENRLIDEQHTDWLFFAR